MPHELTKIVYRASPESTEDFMIIVNPEEYKRWKEGGESIAPTRSNATTDALCPSTDTTIPLAEVVDSFEVFWSNQGSQGILGRPSKQQLENVFGSSKDVDVVKAILEKGREEAGKGFRSSGNPNVAKGSFTIDTKGKSTSGI
ncbi:ribosome maturation protein [Epithele typhae]|uniref:ribosome maturation protein n=1 Tax=Epithele typhae TaxID=378194 RepID=UPI002007B8F1|nr:ribosome maturation protein [Epithele typhae]KAH9943247.1 ribosome maturation protein [Epithele typhae]